MLKINILTPFRSNEFTRQLPFSFRTSNKYQIVENGDLNDSYDFVIVYEGLNSEVRLNCIQGNLLFISGEPPMSRIYTDEFLHQFNHIISSHSRIKHNHHIQSQQALPWHFGFDFQSRDYKYSFDGLVDLKCPRKLRKMSIIASNKTMMPGHKKRKLFIDELRNEFGDEIDFYGKGINPINDKADAIEPYFMSICIENSSIQNYWTEKIADAYLGYTLPIYYGCTNIDNYFPSESFFRLELTNIKKSIRLIRYLLDNCESIYRERFNSLLSAREILLHQYNIHQLIVDFYEGNGLCQNKSVQQVTLYPNETFEGYKTQMRWLKLRRFVIRYFYLK